MSFIPNLDAGERVHCPECKMDVYLVAFPQHYRDNIKAQNFVNLNGMPVPVANKEMPPCVGCGAKIFVSHRGGVSMLTSKGWFPREPII